MTLSTQNVFTSRTGTGWTVDVTICNLDPDVLIKDFLVIFTLAGVPTVQNTAAFSKLTPTSIQYNGASIPASTPVEVRRRTPLDPRRLANYFSRFSSDDYNREIERISRRAYEYETSGIGSVGGLSASLLDDAYSAAWLGDIVNGVTRNRLRIKFEADKAAWEAADTGLQGQITTNTGNISSLTTTQGSHNTRLNTLESYQNVTNRHVVGRWTNCQGTIAAADSDVFGTGGNEVPISSTVIGGAGGVFNQCIIGVNAPASGSWLARIYYKATLVYTLGTTRPSSLTLSLAHSVNGGAYATIESSALTSSSTDLTAVTLGGHRDYVINSGNTYAFRLKQSNNAVGGTLAVNGIQLSAEVLGVV
jgi:hypothetical protein